jgi:voltage-gated potassium channel
MLSAARCLQDSNFLRSQRQLGAALAILFTTVSTGLLGAIGVLVFEGAAPTGSIKNPGDALWWALTTMTTVGYGDFAPITHGGKVVAGVLMLIGVSIFGSVSGLIGSIILQNDDDGTEEDKGHSGGDAHSSDVAALSAEVAALRCELAEVKQMLLQQQQDKSNVDQNARSTKNEREIN